MIKEEQIFKAELPFSLERLGNEHQFNLIGMVKREALGMLFDEVLKGVSDFDGFDIDCRMTMEVHSYHSVCEKLNGLKTSNIDTTFLSNEMDRLRILRNRLGGDSHYGNTHIMELTVKTK